MRPAELLALRECVLESSRDVFQDYAIPVGPSVDDALELEPTSQAAAFVGFCGSRLCGTLSIVTPLAILRAARPSSTSPRPAPRDTDLLDWSGELANRLLGRIESKLAALGVQLRANVPHTMYTELVQMPAPSPASVCTLRFQSEGVFIGVCLDAVTLGGEGLFCPGEVEAR